MEDDKPFDAAERYLCDAAEDTMAKWRTSSLVTALKGILERQPWSGHDGPPARLEAFRTSADELTRRGLDAFSLVRYGMGPRIVSAVVDLLAQSTIEARELSHGMSRAQADAWWRALELPPRPSFSSPPAGVDAIAMIRQKIFPSFSRILAWVSIASIEDLLELVPPQTIIPQPSAMSRDEEALRSQYAWAVDHFSSTFFSEWSTSSLYHAYRWLNGNEVPPCAPELMDDRQVDSVALNAEIARRAVSRGLTSIPKITIDISFSPEMANYAMSLLDEKRYRAAAEIFEFGARQKPYSGEYRNNQGFCLIPEDAEEALGHLKAAIEMNYRAVAVNTYNQMCCYIALRRMRDALRVADSMWHSISSEHAGRASLWRYSEENGWEIFHSNDARASVAELSKELAQDAGWDDEERTWGDRLHNLAGN